jgi:hypothetical protein
MIASKQSDVSNLFVSLVTEKPVFNVNIPILRNGEVRYILHLGQFADDLVGIMRGQRLGPEWTAVILDRKGVVLARSRDQERFVGRTYPQFASDAKIAARGLIKGTNLDGEQVLRAVVRSKQSGWFVTAGIPLAMAEAPLRRSLWQWGALLRAHPRARHRTRLAVRACHGQTDGACLPSGCWAWAKRAHCAFTLIAR